MSTQYAHILDYIQFHEAVKTHYGIMHYYKAEPAEQVAMHKCDRNDNGN